MVGVVFRFFLKCFLVIVIFFVGVMLGMQKANTGLVNMRGYDDPQLNSAISITDENGELSASIMGQQVDSHDLEEKKKRIQELKAFNFFSTMGKKVSDGTKDLFDKALKYVVPD